MGESLKITQETSGARTSLILVGQIDEAADYSGVVFDGIDNAVVDFEAVTLINSTGLQKWLSFLEQIPTDVSLSFENCTTKVVRQIDMFPGFLGSRNVVVKTFYAPYYCEKCDKASNVLLKLSEVEKEHKAPESRCETCDHLMEFDAIEKKYFMFLDLMKPE